MRTFACIESQFVAARGILAAWRIGAAAMTLARAQGRASTLEFARPRFRRQIREGDLSPAPQRSDSYSSSPEKSEGRFGCHPAVPVSCGIREPTLNLTRQRIPCPAVKQMAPATDLPRAEQVDADRLFASLVFRTVRPRNRSADGERGCFSRDPKSGFVSSVAPDIRSLFALRCGRVVTRPQTGSPDPVPPSMETLFAELAWRRLRRLAAGEKF